MLDCNLCVEAAQRNIGIAIVSMSLRSASRLLASCSRLRAWQIGQCPALQHVPVTEQPTTLASAQPSWLESRRSLHFSAALLAVEDVVVPSMGDSITEGGNVAAFHVSAVACQAYAMYMTLRVQFHHLCVNILAGQCTDYVDTLPPFVADLTRSCQLLGFGVHGPQKHGPMCTGTIVNVSKAAGDTVAEDEVIAQIETDKVTIDVRAPHAGTLSSIMVRSQPIA